MTRRLTPDALAALEALLAGDVSPAPWSRPGDVPEPVVFASGQWVADFREGWHASDPALVVALVNAAPELLRLARVGLEVERHRARAWPPGLWCAVCREPAVTVVWRGGARYCDAHRPEGCPDAEKGPAEHG